MLILFKGGKMTRYTVDWCGTSHDDIKQKTFDVFEEAKKFALAITHTDIFIGACGITEQESEKHRDEAGIFLLWNDVKTWECDGEDIYEI